MSDHDNNDGSSDGRTGLGRRRLLQALGVGALGTLLPRTVTAHEADQPAVRFLAGLTGGAEVPPVRTPAGGIAGFTPSPDGESMSYRIIVQNLTDAVAAHIHYGGPEENGPVVATLFDDRAQGRTDGLLVEGTLTAADLVGPLAGRPLQALVDDLRVGNAYVNVHTAQNPAGEIRGQLPDERREEGAGPGTGVVRFVHDTHVHGGFGDPDEPENVSNYFGLMADLARQPGTLRVGNGDDLASSVLSSVFEGRHVVDAFNAGRLDYNTFGNHDFDLGPAVASARTAESHFTWLSANLRDTTTGEVFAAAEGARRYVVVPVNGVDVGLTGLINEEAPEITNLGDEAQVVDTATAMRETIPMMRADGADVVVVLSHLTGPAAEELAAAVDGIDAIIGDHAAGVSETLIEVNDTVIALAGDEYEFVGEVELTVEDGAVTDAGFTLHDVAETIDHPSFEPSGHVEAVASFYRDQLDAELDVVIGEWAVEFDTRRETVRQREANSGNFVADAMRENQGTDVALMNGGGIRTDTLYPPGEVTKKTIFDILPFGNTVMSLEVSGQDLLDALENGVSQVDELAGRFAQVSGMTYDYDPTAPEGSRVSNVTVGGADIDPSATYTLATPNFVAGGGDGYSMFEDATVLVSADDGPLLAQLVVDEIEAESPVAPTVEGRIEVLEG